MEENDPMAQWPTGRLLSMAARLVEHAWADALEKLNLSHAGLIVLHLLDGGALSQTELAHLARVEVQTMSRTLDRLERAGFVEREKHPDDGRRHVVTRTAPGTSAWLAAQTLEADLFPAVSDNPALRTALLEVISTTAADRWS